MMACYTWSIAVTDVRSSDTDKYMHAVVDDDVSIQKVGGSGFENLRAP